jgi:hypothetical protein
MFVRKKKYDALADENLKLMGENAMLQERSVYLSHRLHDLGDLLEKEMRKPPRVVKIEKRIKVSGFTEEEIKKLLMLCHPDKHNGKQMAVEMTQKLLALRK